MHFLHIALISSMSEEALGKSFFINKLKQGKGRNKQAGPKDREEYKAENVSLCFFFNSLILFTFSCQVDGNKAASFVTYWNY